MHMFQLRAAECFMLRPKTSWRQERPCSPYRRLLALQAAVGVVQKGLRPAVPPGTPGPLAAIMAACWVREPEARPGFEVLKEQLEAILEAARQDDMKRANAGFLSKLRKGKP